jgi:hypothetical protein
MLAVGSSRQSLARTPELDRRTFVRDAGRVGRSLESSGHGRPSADVCACGGGCPRCATSLAVVEGGFASASRALPYRDVIQASFGRHDVSTLRAHLGPAASDASRSLGALAYASGERVAFAGRPTLHTAAHEAAHVIQQRAGVSPHDVHERHADAVADRVVRGQSAERLLDAIRPRARAVGSTRRTVQLQRRGVPSLAQQGRGLLAWQLGRRRRTLGSLQSFIRALRAAIRLDRSVAGNRRAPASVRAAARRRIAQARRDLRWARRQLGRVRRQIRRMRAGFARIGGLWVSHRIAAHLVVVRGEVRQRTGVDILAGSSSLRSLNAATTVGRVYGSWHKTGQAVDLNQHAPYVIVRDGTRFRLYLEARAGARHDVMGSQLRHIYRNPFRARLRTMRLVDVTRIFVRVGFRRVPRLGGVAEWWHYERRGGLTWYQALRDHFGFAYLRRLFRRHIAAGLVTRRYLRRHGVPNSSM